MSVSLTGDVGLGTRLLIQLRRGGGEFQRGGEIDWQALLAACDYHQVAPSVFGRLQELGVPTPSPVIQSLRERLYRIAAYNHFLAERLVRWVSRLEQEGIRALVLKGPAVAIAAYGDLSLRQYEDIDLLVRRDQVGRAVEMLLAQGFEPVRGHTGRHKSVDRYHEVTLQAPGGSYTVDLHWQLAPPYASRFGPAVSEVWERAEPLPLPHGTVSVPSRPDLFVALCQHGARHRWWQLKWLFDVAELLRRSDEMDWYGLEQSMKARPMAQPAASLAALLAQDLLGLDLPGQPAGIFEATERIRALARSISAEFQTRGQTSRSAHDTLLGLEQRPLVRAKYMLGEALQYPVREVLFTITPKDSQFLRLPEKVRPFYYLVRPLRLLVQHGRGAARRIWSMAR